MKPLSQSITIGTVIGVVLISIHATHAGSATWDINPTNDWNAATNWTPNTVPNSPDDTATFGNTNQHTPMIHSDIALDTLLFTADASAPIAITVGDASSQVVASLTFSGTGLVNDTDFFQFYEQTVQAAPTLLSNGGRNVVYFTNDAGITTGDGLTGTGVVAQGGTSPDLIGGQIQFLDNSDASKLGAFAGIAANGGANGGGGGEIWFFDNSTAGNGDIGNGSSDADSTPGTTYFMGNSTAGDAAIGNTPTHAPDGEGGKTFFLESSTAGASIIYAGGGAYGERAGGGIVTFSDTASASNAVLSAYGGFSGGLDGSFIFLSDSTGGTAQVVLTGTGNLVISDHNPPGITIGSLSDGNTGGGGIVILGSNNLTVGSNNLNTEFSGVVEGTGSLKIGGGKLTLTGASLYQGGTILKQGKLLVNNRTGSGTGGGLVSVLGGTLGGRGTIAGPVIIGDGQTGKANLALSAPQPLTIQNTLLFNSKAAFRIGINSNNVKASAVVAKGVTISAARFVVSDVGNTTLPAGTTFIVINNTAAAAIDGAFTNLPDGSIVTVGSNTFQANYEGGDGNDLTLTVVP